jgi:hypothetical protein
VSEGLWCKDNFKLNAHRSSAFSFQCLEAGGAVLALPKGATVYEAMNKLDFQRHAARHAVGWYEYMLNKGRDVTNGSLYFVTDCIKSVNWGIATFYASPAANDYLHLVFDERSCRWEYLGKVEARDGPRSTDIVTPDGGEPNQCVFLRGYKIMLQPHVWHRLRSTIVVGSQGGKPSSPSTRGSQGHDTSGGRTNLSHQRSSDGGGTNMDPASRITRDQASQLMHTQESRQFMLEDFCSATVPVRGLVSFPQATLHVNFVFRCILRT